MTRTERVARAIEALRFGEEYARVEITPLGLRMAEAALTAIDEERDALREAARNALMLIESGEFLDTACLDPDAIAAQLRAALEATKARSLSSVSREEN